MVLKIKACMWFDDIAILEGPGENTRVLKFLSCILATAAECSNYGCTVKSMFRLASRNIIVASKFQSIL